jgi:septum formation protein
MLVLASASPRRRELLSNAGISFTIRIPNVGEEVEDGENALTYVQRVAAKKAAAVNAAPDEVVLAADTVVSVQGSILGKPASAEDAAAMLRTLSGNTHEVLTGICLRHGERSVVDVSVTKVRFLPMTEDDIVEYVRSGEPMDKAGAYGIQGLASRFVESIEGCYFNVVGLPVSLVCQRLRDLGIRISGVPSTEAQQPTAFS